MKKSAVFSMAALGLVSLAVRTPVFAGAKDAAGVMKLMPADFPVSVVVVDLAKFDKSLSAVMKRFGPNDGDEGLLKQVRDIPAIGEWIDFSKPVGMAGPSLGGESPPIVWAHIPDFTAKVKALANAKETDGVWFVPSEDAAPAGEDAAQEPAGMYLRAKGDYVVAAETKELLAAAFKEGRSLADDFGPRMSLLEGRDLLAHVNFEQVRPMALAGLAQASQMVPMIAMMAAQQGGSDPAALTGLFTGLFDATKKFVEQVAYIDVVAGISDTAADITLATGYKDGEIKSYLAAQKPAAATFFNEIEDQPFVVAFASHVPGDKSPFFDYAVDKTIGAMKAAAPATPPAGEGDKPGEKTAEGSEPAEEPAAPALTAKQIEESARVAKELYRKIEGAEGIISLPAGGMEFSGSYFGGDTQGILKLLKESLTQQKDVFQNLKGMQWESRGDKKIDGVAVEEFAMKVDPSNPAAAMFGGGDVRFAVGISRERVRLGMGGDTAMARTFSGKTATPLSGSKFVTEALATLPAKRNAVVLIDPAGALPFIAPLIGMPKMDAVAPGPPVAISVSLVGDPARLDIHLPFRAIERVIQAMTPDQGM